MTNLLLLEGMSKPLFVDIWYSACYFDMREHRKTAGKIYAGLANAAVASRDDEAGSAPSSRAGKDEQKERQAR